LPGKNGKVKTIHTIRETQEEMKALLNHKITVHYHNRGKDYFDVGEITAVFDNIFIFEYVRSNQTFKSSFTYKDVMTREIIINELQ